MKPKSKKKLQDNMSYSYKKFKWKKDIFNIGFKLDIYRPFIVRYSLFKHEQFTNSRLVPTADIL